MGMRIGSPIRNYKEPLYPYRSHILCTTKVTKMELSKISSPALVAQIRERYHFRVSYLMFVGDQWAASPITRDAIAEWMTETGGEVWIPRVQEKVK